MHISDLLPQQQASRTRILDEYTSSPTRAEDRALAHADAREWRLLQAMNDAVFWGTLKAHLVLLLVGGIAWGLIVAYSNVR